MANNGRFEYTISFKTDDNGLKQAKQALQELQNITTKTPGFENMSIELQLAKKHAAELEGALSRSFNVKLKTTDVAKLRNELSQMNLNEMYKDLSAIGPKGEEVFNRMATQAMKTNLQVKQGNTLLMKFGETLRRNLEWMLAGNLINTITGVFQKAYGFTKNLDSSLNDIRIVTGKSADEMARFGEEAQKTAAALGKGTTDITNASLIFYQQGLDTAEVNARTEVSTKLANVTKQSTDITADQLTAVWNGYKATNDELERYADIMTGVAASTASSSAELAGAISKVASVANATGVDMEQLTAMMSTVISVTRESPETVGTAFKTIFARINDLVEDGTDEFGVSLGRISSHLKAMGIEILDENGNLKDLGDTLSKVGNDWNQYSREQQVAIAEQIGGKRQWNQVIALFDNWSKYSDALDVAKNSTGELQRQQEVYMESTAAHLQAVKTAWEGVYGQLMSSDDINKVADFFTAILKKVETFLESIGGIGPVLQMVAGYMLQAFGPKIGQQMANTINNFRIMKDNASQIAAQRDLTRIIGSVEDNALMQKLVGQHQQILKYKNLMTEADRKEYEEYLDQTVALDAKEKQLKKEIQDTEELLSKRKALSEEYQSGGKNLSGGGFATETLERAQNTAKNYLENQTVDTHAGVIQLGTAKYSVADNLVDNRKNQISDMASKIDKEIQSGQLSEEAVKKYEALSNALKKVSKDFENAKNSGEISIGSFKKHEEQVEKSAKRLKSFETELSKLGIDLQSLTRQGDETSQFWDENSDVLMRSEKTIKDYTTAIEEMATNGTLTTEQVEELNKKLQALNNLDVSDPGHLNDYKNIIQSINADLKNFATQAQGDLAKIGEAIENNTSTQLKNTQAGLKSWGDSFNQIINNLNVTAFVDNITSLANYFNQLNIAVSQFTNLLNILSDTKTTGVEKLSKALSAMAFMLPSLITTFKGLNTVFSISNVQAVKAARAKAQENTETLKQIRAKRTIIYEGHIEEVTQWQINKAIKDGIITKEEDIRCLKKGQAEKIKAISVTKAETAATEELTLSQKSLNAAFIANPILAILTAVITGITIVTSLISANNQKLKEAQEEQKELWDKQEEANDNIIEQNENLQKSTKSLEELWDTYDRGKTSIEELDEGIREWTQSLSESEQKRYEHLIQIAQLTGNYEALKQAIKETKEAEEEAAEAALKHNLYTTGSEATSYFTDIQWQGRNYTTQNGITSTSSGTGIEVYANEDEKDDALKAFFGTYGSHFDQDRPGKIEDIVRESIRKSGIDTTEKDISQALFNLGLSFANGIFDPAQLQQDLQLSDDELKNVLAEILPAFKQWQAQFDVTDTAYQALNPIVDYLESGIGEYSQYRQAEQIQAFNKKVDEYKENKKEQLSTDNKDTDLQIGNLYEGILKDLKDINYKTGEKLNEDELKTKAISILKEINPEMGEQIEKSIGSYLNVVSTKETLNKGLHQLNESWDELTDATIQEIQTKLRDAGLELTDIDWESAASDPIFMEKFHQIINQRKGIQDEDVEAFRQYETEISKTKRDLDQDFTELIDTFNNVNKKIEKGTLSDRNLKNNKEYKALMADEVQQDLLDFYGPNSEIGQAIEILNSDISTSSEKWKEAWKIYGEAIKNAGVESAIQDMDEALEKISKDREGKVVIHADAKDYAEAMDDILAADYSIDVEIHSKIDADVGEIKSDLKEVSDLVTKIDDGFTLSGSELDDFADKMPSILDNMQVLSDGTIQLSQEAVDETKKQVLEETNAKIDGEIQTIKAQKAVVEHKKQTADKALDIAHKMAKGEYKTSESLNSAMTDMDNLVLDLKEDNDLQEAISEGNINKQRLEQLAQFYGAALNQAEEYAQTRKQIIEEGKVKTGDSWTVNSYAEDLGYTFTSTGEYSYFGGHVLDKTSIENEINLGKALEAMFQSQSDDYQKSIDAFDTQISILESYKTNTEAVWNSVGKSTSSTKDNTSATKDNAAAQAQLIEILNEEIDAYHDINIEIKQLETQLSRLQKQQAKLTGDALLKNLQEQLELLEKQNDAYLRKYDIMSMETAATRASLADQGVEFNSDGTISNYAAMIQQKQQYVQDLQNQYNNMSKEEQDGFKDTVEQAKKDYENFKKAITDYDSLITEKIPELQDKIQDIADKEIEIQISKAKMKVQAILDDQDLKRTEIEFKKKLARLKDDDILGNLTVNLEVMATYTADNGSLIALQQEVDRLTQVKADMDAGIFFSSEYGDNRAKLEEDLKAYSDQLRQQKEAVISLRDAIQDAYVSALDQVNEKLDEQKEKYKQISDMLEKQINLYQIRFGDNTFDAINGLMKHQTDLAQKQYNVSLKQLEIFKKEYEKLLEQDPNEELEITQQAKKHFEEANAKVYEDLVSLFEARQKQYENAVKAFFEIFNRQLTGGKDLDYVKDSWDRLNADADDYYDAVNGAYEINKLRNQIEKDINKSTDPNVQKQLTNFLNQQVAALEKKDKLSKYDLERANAMYDLEVKRATFQEAQQNKSKMRLRRDSQGNYSYQFVSDEQQVADSIQELAEAQNKLYNVDSSALKDSLDKILKIQQEHQDAMIDTTGKTDEEIKEINDYYNKKQQEAVAEYWEIRNNLMESGLDAYAQKMGMTTDEVKRLTTEQKDAIMSDLVPAWNSAAAAMVENMGGPDGITAMFASTYDSLSQIRQDYFDDLDDYADAAGVDLENIQTAADATIDIMSSLMDSTDEVVDSLEEMLDKVLNVINALTGTPQDMKSALEDLMKTLKPLTDLFPQYINTAQQAVDAAQQTQQVVSNGGNSNTNNGNDNNNGGNNNTNTANNNPTADFNSTSAERDDWGEGNFPKIGDKVIYLGEDYYYDSWGNGPSGNRGAGENKVVEVENISPNSPYPIAVKSNDSAYGWLKKHQIAKMAKGGYTGDWANTNGKLGILHEKELILNANRTQNLFKAFDSLTNPTKVVQNLMSGLEIMLRKQQFSFLDNKLRQAEDNGAIERNTIINANFPGVHAAVEIEKALNDLINLSTQQVHSTLR